jgi:hypothetical protein
MPSQRDKLKHRVPRITSAAGLRFSFCATNFPTTIFTAIATAALCVFFATAAAAQDRGWEYAPYRIRAMLSIDAPGGLADRLAIELPEYLSRRVTATVGPAWAFEVQLTSGVSRHAVLVDIEATSAPSADFNASDAAQSDKLLLLAVRATPDGFELAAREFDSFVQRWSPPIRRVSRQADMLPEQMFALVWHAVAPLARLELDPSAKDRVQLHVRAAELLRARPSVPWARDAEVYLPILRRTTRSGALAENGIQVVPWTYIETAEVDDEKVVGRVRSANRQPLAGRRQGRVKQVAIAIRSDLDDTHLQLQSRSDPNKPLVGYEVFAQQDGGELDLLGSSDASGRVEIPPGDTRITTVVIKHGGQLLARLPIVPGAANELIVPLPDDDARLAAESRLAALREDLIDVVARRNILSARIRQKVAQKDISAAQELLRALDELPGLPQFNLTLTTAARALRSDDPQIQRRIDRLFEATQSVLAQYLNPRQISELHDEVASAQRK